jgi:hypothetical protein
MHFPARCSHARPNQQHHGRISFRVVCACGLGFWAAAFPDSDFIVDFMKPLSYLALHRGITHSVILLLI